MKFFLDTAHIEDVKELLPTGWVDGITTNPSLIAASGRKFLDVIAEMCDLIEGPVSAEVAATDYAMMLTEGRHLAKISGNVAVKLPLTMDGLKACYALTQEGTMVNVTLCFSAAQALLAAKAGATFVSPFVGRLDDVGHDGMALIQEICQIYAMHSFDTEVLAASIRHPQHVIQAAQRGADVATIPPKVIHQLLHHPLTDKGVELFTSDWKKTGQSIL
ncbi:fructose-6-phosphate aldolase [Candidatus Finniella inopinata]|uniref:Probable transaldolase n=1 Tax=Candidatus Finniella inopinata TaxID=1696036 RepID=A0A4Q7DJE6_9PROT|nr:fructose-6-phosphate aldolase [Candidatus Finniella inopinata]RZI46275.1 fructose-6-phosphate aldolase [Candidatus Finniella inopinata]